MGKEPPVAPTKQRILKVLSDRWTEADGIGVKELSGCLRISESTIRRALQSIRTDLMKKRTRLARSRNQPRVYWLEGRRVVDGE